MWIEIAVRSTFEEPRGLATTRRCKKDLHLDVGVVRVSRMVRIHSWMNQTQVLTAAAEVLVDNVLEELRTLATPTSIGADASSYILVGRRPGITDDEGAIAKAELCFGLNAQNPANANPIESVAAFTLYSFQNSLSDEVLRQVGMKLLGNELVDEVRFGKVMRGQGATDGQRPLWEEPLPLPSSAKATVLEQKPKVVSFELLEPDAVLVAMSDARGLAFSLAEMHALRDHLQQERVQAARTLAGMPHGLTECELEVFAQTWSEHCKHKEFNAAIAFTHDGATKQVDSLFKTYIRGATETLRARYGASDWMVTVFSDNAGVVRLDADRLFVLKVETHNSPSALDPVGGAMTGILGNNRDVFGTGKGGAKLLFNTNVLCFAPPDYAKPLLTGQMHPARIMEGVRDGIEQGGNKSGVPTVNGAIVFDDRYAGKPLVYCGTGGLLPAKFAQTDSHTKEIRAGDRIVLIGGRTGRDGIHGATYSSIELTQASPRSIVQIGSPFLQKLVADFTSEACKRGLIAGTTDNGAGGLSSSVGELATVTGGARLQLRDVPLKTEGLAPWEILVSESQERMTLGVKPEHLDACILLARAYGVEATDIGEFRDDGILDVVFGDERLAWLDLVFLHEGVPRKYLEASWQTRTASEPTLAETARDHTEVLHALLGSWNISSRESIVRQYDHEVQGLSVMKPYMGPTGKSPQDAGIVRISHEDFIGLAVASGICPKYGDLDPYAMSACAFDEALRSLISVGVPLSSLSAPSCISACDNFCVPDSAYDPQRNPDGREKLGALVRMCEALRDMSLAFDVPMTSGKDSMKNDFRGDGVKISVPPTVLYTMVGKLPDVRRAVTAEAKAVGDVLVLIGETFDELGASEFYKLAGLRGANVPTVRVPQAHARYLAMGRAHAASLFVSSHDLSDGGLAVALAEVLLGTGLGANVILPSDELSDRAWLYSESPSRFLTTVKAEALDALCTLFGPDAYVLGTINASAQLEVRRANSVLIAASMDALASSHKGQL